MRSLRPLVFAALATSALGACSKPEPPTVTPISGRVMSIDSTGMKVEAKLEAWNPNDFELGVKSFTAKITLDHQYNIGTVTSPHAVMLPPKKKKTFEVPISLKWNDVAALAPLALQNRDVPWEAEGTVKVSADSIDVELPFKVSGTVTHQQIVQAVGKSLPKGLPALPF
jgi:LEA14-like dessication related protein